MAYRDELHAARARIADLEEELAGFRNVHQATEASWRREQDAALATAGDELRRAQWHSARLETRIRDLESAEAERRALEEQVAALTSELAAARGEPVERTMKTLRERNCELALNTARDRTGVSCPACAYDGLEVEMIEAGMSLAQFGKLNACPRCGYAGYLRRS